MNSEVTKPKLKWKTRFIFTEATNIKELKMILLDEI